MIFGKHINRYYFRYAHWLILGLIALVTVDSMQLVIPKFYRMIINGMNGGMVEVKAAMLPFDMDFLLDHICMPLLGVALCMVICRFLWRVCFFGTAIRVEEHLRNRMFDHALPFG